MILLDTCTLLWLAADQSKLSTSAVHAVKENIGEIFVSSISAFEIAVKYFKKKIILPMEPLKWYGAILEHHGFRDITVDYQIAIISAGLIAHHNDPADRIIIATSLVHNLSIITPDPIIKRYPEITVIW